MFPIIFGGLPKKREANPSLLTGLLAFYRFDGNGNDSSGNGQNMAMTGDGYGPGLLGQALVQGFGTAAIPLTSGVWSLSAWVETPTISQTDNGGRIEFTDPFIGPEVFRVVGGDGDLPVISFYDSSFAYPVPDASWVHVVAVCDGSTQSVYIDGELYGPNTVTPALPDGKITCIADRDLSTPFDLVGVWNRLLTSGEVATLYNGGAGFDPTA